MFFLIQSWLAGEQESSRVKGDRNLGSRVAKKRLFEEERS